MIRLDGELCEKDAAKFVGLSPTRLAQLRLKGRGPVYRRDLHTWIDDEGDSHTYFGHYVWYTKHDLIYWIEHRKDNCAK